MSVAGLLDAMHSEYPPAHRLVWMCLESHANSARWWRITERELAEELHLGLNTISRAVEALVADGVVAVERHKRQASLFRMLRRYPPAKGLANGRVSDDQGELTPQNEESTQELTPQNGVLTGQLTPQNEESTALVGDVLTPQNGDPTPELTPQNGVPLESNSKNPTERKIIPPNPPQEAGGVVVAFPGFDNPQTYEEVLAWAEERSLSADDVAEAAAAIADKLRNGRLRRCTDPLAELRTKLRGIQTWREIKTPRVAEAGRMRRDRVRRGLSPTLGFDEDAYWAMMKREGLA